MQFKLHKRTELALRAIRRLAGAGRTVAGSDLAEEIGTSSHYLPQVMAPLVASGWVRSERGPNGGYTLATGTDDLSMRSLIEAVEGLAPSGRCVLLEGPCPGDATCALHDSWQQVMNSLWSELEQIPVFET